MFRGNQRTQADRGTYATDLFRREALRFLDESGDQPWLLYLGFNAPHGASSFGPDPADKKTRPGVQAPDEYLALYRGKLPNQRLEGFYAAVTCMDAAIGEVLKWLEDHGQAERTLILFLSDNGGSGNGGNAPLRGGKGQMGEGGLRVPLVARWPGQLPAGRVSDEFLSTLEIFPSLLAAADVAPPPGVVLDGFDMLPILRGEKPSPRTEMFWQRGGQQAARVGHWKWVGGAGGGLFDLSRDLGERQDVSAEQPPVLEKVRARFAAWQQAMEAAEPRGPFRDY